MTTPTIDGLHHVTAIGADPQRNYGFWAKVVGLRFVKRTVNFDDPSVYHLYYTATRSARPAPCSPSSFGRAWREGVGEASLTSFAIPPGSVPFWLDRLAAHGVEHEPPAARLGEETIVFQDPDGTKAALVVPGERFDERASSPWTTPEIGAEHAVRGFHGVILTLADRTPMAQLLTDIFGYEPASEEGGLARFAAPRASRARFLDIIERPDGLPAHQGAGRVHHVAFSVRDDAAQEAVRERLIAAGLRVTPQIDRNYFHSIYFRTPGGVLFEIATEHPGFTVDEGCEELGRGLKLPPQHEQLQARLERELPPLAF